MADVNIRGFPQELLRTLKVAAAKSGKTLKQLIIERLDGTPVTDVIPRDKPAKSTSVTAVTTVTDKDQSLDCPRCDGVGHWVEKGQKRECSRCAGTGRV